MLLLSTGLSNRDELSYLQMSNETVQTHLLRPPPPHPLKKTLIAFIFFDLLYVEK